MHLIFQLNNKELLEKFLNENNQYLLIEKNDNNKTAIDMMSNKMLKGVLTNIIEKNNNFEENIKNIENIEKNQNILCQMNIMNYLDINNKINILGMGFIIFILKDLFTTKCYL